MTTGRVTVNLDPPASTDRELQLWVGGPVEPHRSWILIGHDGEPDDIGTAITDNLYLSTSRIYCAGCSIRILHRWPA